jgi:putative ABC transport system substrate-binding protein
VASLARPGGNITGVATLERELLAKRSEILRELLPNVATIGLIANPDNPNTASSVRELQELAQNSGWRLEVVNVRTGQELDASVGKLAELGAGAFLTATDGIITNGRFQLAKQAARYRIPAIYPSLVTVEAGGLMSYGSVFDRLGYIVGIYTGRILKGEKPADLPVQQATKVELVINLKTAKTLGITFPTALLVRADQVIE